MLSAKTDGGGSEVDGIPAGTYGFIGIGVMGYGMAANLRAKLSKSSRLIICEVDQERRQRFFAERQGLLEVANSPRELVEKSVGFQSGTATRMLT